METEYLKDRVEEDKEGAREKVRAATVSVLNVDTRSSIKLENPVLK